MARRTKLERYAAIREQVAHLIDEVADPVARRATLAAILHHKLPGVSWTGFYMLSDGNLVVDAYQGPVACLVLEPPEGVCWAAVTRREPIVVEDVSAFPGHVPCDERAESEIVVPLFGEDGAVTGVLDLDSQRAAHFDEEDREGLERLVTVLGAEAGGVADLTPFVRLALDCVGREYPVQIPLHLDSADDLELPRAATPAFFGCYDWHSAVHSHWVLARALRLGAAGDLTQAARDALAASLTPENIREEVRFVTPRPGFERPYGLAWLLQLATELHEWDDPTASVLAANLAPLAALARERFSTWLPALTHPVRTGVHSQTAFALGLVLDHARVCGHAGLETLVEERTRAYHRADRDYPLHLEPSGEDFLSPSLGAADLMRRVMVAGEFADWLGRVLPEFQLEPVEPRDRSDGRLTHLDGLNLSRAFMLEGIAAGLPGSDPRISPLLSTAAAHRERGLAAVTGDRYEGGHWLGSFAVYLVTRRG